VLGRVASDAEARAFLLSRASRNRVFLATMARIWLAYRVEAMRYVVLTAVKA
jgi:tocopherol O-methyltransferase